MQTKKYEVAFEVPVEFIKELGYDDPSLFGDDFVTELESRVAPEILVTLGRISDGSIDD
jgi:hypothetical protein